MRLIKLLVVVSIVLGLLLGCGGGGSSSATRNKVRGNVRLFLTDNLHDGYDHVWVNIKKIALVGGTREAVLFSNPDGKVVDVRSLRDASGQRFLMLSAASVPAGNYSALHVTVGRELSIVPTGATTAVNATFEGGTSPEQLLVLGFHAPEEVDSDQDFVIDFDLAGWELSGTVVSASGGYLRQGDETGLDDEDRHDASEIEGQISELSGTAPNQTFLLDGVRVRTTAATVLFNENGSPTPVLANGKYVTATGKYDVSTDEFDAEGVTIYEDEPDQVEQDEVGGAFVSGDATAGTLVLQLEDAEGFMPETTQMTVKTTDQTSFVGCNGSQLTKAEFFAMLTPGMSVEAGGTLVGGEFNAAVIWACDGEEESEPEDSEFSGGASLINASLRTFSITVQEFDGENVALETLVNVSVAEGATFYDRDTEITAEQFFGLLTNGKIVGVCGIYDENTRQLVASSLWIGDIEEDDDHDEGDEGGGEGDGDGT